MSRIPRVPRDPYPASSFFKDTFKLFENRLCALRVVRHYGALTVAIVSARAPYTTCRLKQQLWPPRERALAAALALRRG
jgi:hypothetical protein